MNSLLRTAALAAFVTLATAAALAGDIIANIVTIDGDTIRQGQTRIRMVDYDTPEIHSPKCAAEKALGEKAKQRLEGLLANASDIQILPSGKRDTDYFGRKLRLVMVDGRSVGDILIAEGLAVKWTGRKPNWCQKLGG